MYYCLLERSKECQGLQRLASPITAGSLCIAALKNAGWAGQALASLIIYLHLSTQHTQALRDLVVFMVMGWGEVLVTSTCLLRGSA